MPRDDSLWLVDQQQQFRELADVSVLWHEGAWYMYPSVDMAWVSKDGGATWQHHPLNVRDVGYAPTIVKHKGKFLLMASESPVYAADSPLGPFKEIGRIKLPAGVPGQIDPMLFSDDDGRLFYYWGCTPTEGIFGVELDADDPTRVIGKPAKVIAFEPDKQPWQRLGDWNEQPARGWVEGAWMLKRDGKYYLTYAAAGTENRTYAMGCAVGKSPLGPFVPQKNNPILRTTTGLITGTAHGCVVEGPHNSLWAFYTVRAGGGARVRAAAGDGPGVHRGGRGTARQRGQFAAAAAADGVEGGGAGGVAAAERGAADRGLQRRAEPVRAAGGGRRPAHVVAAGGGRQGADAHQQPDDPRCRGACGAGDLAGRGAGHEAGGEGGGVPLQGGSSNGGRHVGDGDRPQPEHRRPADRLPRVPGDAGDGGATGDRRGAGGDHAGRGGVHGVRGGAEAARPGHQGRLQEPLPHRHGGGHPRQLLRRGVGPRQGALQHRDAGELHEAGAGSSRRGQMELRAARRPREVVRRQQVAVHGHALVWHAQTNNWFFSGGDKEVVTRRMKDHISTLVGRYRGKVQGWDVVNEAINDNGNAETAKTENLRNSQWLRAVGPEFFTLAFKFAHDADPDAKLYYNDYGIEAGPKHESSMVLLRRLIKDVLCTVPGIGWILAYTIAAEIGDINRFADRVSSPATPACAQRCTSQAKATSAASSPRGSQLPALGAAEAAATPVPRRLPRPLSANKRRLGKQRGAKVAQVDIARRLAEAIWHMLTRNQPFAPAGATDPLAA